MKCRGHFCIRRNYCINSIINKPLFAIAIIKLSWDPTYIGTLIPNLKKKLLQFLLNDSTRPQWHRIIATTTLHFRCHLYFATHSIAGRINSRSYNKKNNVTPTVRRATASKNQTLNLPRLYRTSQQKRSKHRKKRADPLRAQSPPMIVKPIG